MDLIISPTVSPTTSSSKSPVQCSAEGRGKLEPGVPDEAGYFGILGAIRIKPV